MMSSYPSERHACRRQGVSPRMIREGTMTKRILLAWGWVISGLALASGWQSPVGAVEPVPSFRETREFEVLVKGKPQGFTRFKLEHFPDRRMMVVTTDAEVRVNLVVYVYTFEFHGSETWVDNRLERFSASGTDGGKKYTLSGMVQPNQSQVTINGKALQGPPFAMTSNYWRLPLLRAFNEQLSLVDASNGDELNGVVIPCTEFRISGDVDVKLWLDRDGFIVRQESIESGYPTEMRLLRMTRENVLASAR